MATPPPLDGTVVVTGASSGIGEAMARQLAARARRLILVARRRSRLDALAAELREGRSSLDVQVRACDLADATARARLIDALLAGPEIDVLINNAGFGDQSLFDRARWDKLSQMIAVDIEALTHLSHALVPAMVERGRGGVLNIGSSLGLSWVPGMAVYVGSKFYVTGFTESLRAEVAESGVAVSQVCPGPVITEFHELAENTTGQRPPAAVAITATQCAREALEGFERGRATIVPGFAIRNLLRLQSVLPQGLWRLIAVRLVRPMRSAHP